MLEIGPGIGACVQAVTDRAVSVSEIAEDVLARIEDLDPAINAFTIVDEKELRAEAKRLDQGLRTGIAGPLAGVPIGVKDLFDVVGQPTSYGSKAYDPIVATSDATTVRLLREAGALIVGKTRTAEFAWSGTTKPTRNPTDLSRTVGGSSGGSAAAVAAGMVRGALGTDTGGSIRQPAALCGIAGIKPTYGLVSRAGVLPTNWSLDHAGPLAGSVDDVRRMLSVLIAHDGLDPASAPTAAVAAAQIDIQASRPEDMSNVRIGLIDNPLFEIHEAAAAAAFDSTVSHLVSMDAQIVRLKLDWLRYVPSAFIAIDLPEGAAVHTERLRTRADDIDPEIRALLRFGHAIPGVLAARGHQARRLIVDRMAETFNRHGLTALVTPASTVFPFPDDGPPVTYTRADGSVESAMWATLRPMWLANMTGQPALAVPVARTPLPLGIQVIGRPYQDGKVLGIGERIEQAA